MKRFCFLVLILVAGIAQADKWAAWGGKAHLEFDPAKLDVLQAQLLSESKTLMDGEQQFTLSATATGKLEMEILGNVSFEKFYNGKLEFSGGPVVQLPGYKLDLSRITLTPTPGQKLTTDYELTLDIVDAKGNPVLYADHIHLLIDRKSGVLTLKNMDVRITQWLASRIDVKGAQHYPLAQLHLETIVQGLAQSEAKGTCPLHWPTEPGFDADVAMERLSFVTQTAQSDGKIAVTPSATLRNVGTASVPWHSKFSGVFPPYDNDQHPYLVWALYKVANGNLTQLGSSEVKHAFLTINSSCTCNPGDGHILGLGCGDTYGSGTNEGRNSLGFRPAINPLTGIWARCGSEWDNDCNNSPDAPPVGDAFDRRLTIAEGDVADTTAEYYMEGWYVVRDDIDIYNTMGSVPVDPHAGATWASGNVGFKLDAVLNRWGGPRKIVSTVKGDFGVALNVTEEGDQLRYHYSVQSFDFETTIEHFRVTPEPAQTVSDFQFQAPFGRTAGDWNMIMPSGGTQLAFNSQDVADDISWGHMYSFSFLSDNAPVYGDARVRDADGDVHTLTFWVPGNQPDSLFEDTF